MENENKEKYFLFLDEAKEHFKIAEHMIYVTFPILKEKRLMIKIIHELYESVVNLVRAFLYYEYSLKKIKIYANQRKNLETFSSKIALKYVDKKTLENLLKIIEIESKHNLSRVEFVRKDKFVILVDDKFELLTMERLKDFSDSTLKLLTAFPKKSRV